MSLVLDTVFLRWYRSFNTASSERDRVKPWERVGNEEFQFVEVAIDPRITTVVGANESGKSHLLSAILKAFSQQEPFTPADICRHCAYDALEQKAVPQIGIRLLSGTADNAPVNNIVQLLGGSVRDSRGVTVVLQPENEPYATLYDDKMAEICTAQQTEWYEASSSIPSIELIEPELKFTNRIHISQLIAAYDEPPKGEHQTFFETMPLNSVGRQLHQASVPATPPDLNQPNLFPGDFVETVSRLQQKLSKHVIQVKGDPRLERDLFEYILGVPKSKLEYIQKLGERDRGYIELLVSNINERIRQRLDLHSYWSQDQDISLGVNYKDGFFYFEIHDKTGKAFTFQERSSGLQYFLSYYVQSLAIKRRAGDRGCVVLMDEPDRFLSAIAQRNLLHVFEMLSGPDDANRLQLVYTTHSPFSINRNYPERLRLVRKGDGSEGTQVVEKTASRSYEPVRTALGIEGGDTLFFGGVTFFL